MAEREDEQGDAVLETRSPSKEIVRISVVAVYLFAQSHTGCKLIGCVLRMFARENAIFPLWRVGVGERGEGGRKAEGCVMHVPFGPIGRQLDEVLVGSPAFRFAARCGYLEQMCRRINSQSVK